MPICDTADQFLAGSFDYVICGGGTAGLVIAARLTEDPNVHVGVLEAGEDRLDDPLVNTPAAFTQMLANPEYDWMLESVPQGPRKQIRGIPRGKMLGGSSGINYMIYTRGSESDLNGWADLTGDSSWSTENMRKYFRKHETLEPYDDSIADRRYTPAVQEYHGHDGPIHTRFNSSFMPVEHDFLNACHEASHRKDWPVDPWSGNHLGFYSSLGCIDSTGPMCTRSYAANGYLKPHLARSNLRVLTNALVNRVILAGEEVKGVEFTHQGKTSVVEAEQEVILSCGVVQSPQILELSGIGDPQILKSAGVECKIPLPAVGENLQDHSLGFICWQLKSGVESLDSLADPKRLAAEQQTYQKTGKGILSNITAAVGFLPYSQLASPSELAGTIESIRRTPNQTPFQTAQLEQVISQLQSPDHSSVHFVSCPATFHINDDSLRDQSKLTKPPPDPSDPANFTLTIGVSNPASRGSTHIKSSSPHEHPAYDPALMHHPADIAIVAAGLRFADSVAQSRNAFGEKLQHRTFPEEHLDMQNDRAALRAFTSDVFTSMYHPVGSCAMTQVVDSRLKLLGGVKGLRVVDASVFPNHVSGNICSAVYALAEKAADMIKEDLYQRRF